MHKEKTKIDDILYFEVAIDEFYDSIDIFDLVSGFVVLQKYDDLLFEGDIDDGEHIIAINKENNKCYIDNELKTIPEIITFFDKSLNPIKYIEKTFDAHIVDFVSGVYLKNGEQIFLDINDISEFKGSSLFIDPNDFGVVELNTLFKRIKSKEFYENKI